MDYLYSLYDALVSINVPHDKARAVVDAMERDMGTTLSTKQDLELLRSAMKGDLDLLRVAVKNDLELHRAETRAEIEAIRSDIGHHKTEVRQEFALVRKDIDFLATRLTVRIGSMLMIGLSILFAALKLV
jgi:hypothetical protein